MRVGVQQMATERADTSGDGELKTSFSLVVNRRLRD